MALVPIERLQDQILGNEDTISFWANYCMLKGNGGVATKVRT